MSAEVIVSYLDNLALFNGLAPHQLTSIANCASRIVYKAGETIIERDGEGDAAVLLVSGQATRTTAPGSATMSEPVPVGSLVGEMAMLIETQHSSTVVAKSPVRAFRIPRAELLQEMLKDPGLAEHFVGRISARLGLLVDEVRRLNQDVAQEIAIASVRTESEAHAA